MPIERNMQNMLNEKLYKSIKGVFECSIKISFYHMLFTWLMFNSFNINFEFITSLLAGLMSLIPLFSPWLLSIPVTLYLIFFDNYIKALLFPVIYIWISNTVFTDIYQKNIDVHPYITGLSVFLGIYAFGIKGIIYGPLLVCLVLIIYEITKESTLKDWLNSEFFSEKIKKKKSI